MRQVVTNSRQYRNSDPVKRHITQSDEPAWRKKSPAYFELLKNQVIDDRERRIFKKDPNLALQSIIPVAPLHRKPLHSIPKQANRSQSPHRHEPRPMTGLHYRPISFGQRCPKLLKQRFWKFTYFTAQQKKLMVQRRFRKYVRAVQIVLTYKKNIKTLHAKRFKRLSVRQKALLAIQNPTGDQKALQEAIIQQQSSDQSSPEPTENPLANLKNRTPQLYFKNNSHKALNQFIIKREIKNSQQSFQTLGEFENKLKKSKSKSKSNCREKLPPVKPQTTSSYRTPSGYFPALTTTKRGPVSGRQGFGSFSHQEEGRRPHQFLDK